MGPAGVTVVIIRDDMLARTPPKLSATFVKASTSRRVGADTIVNNIEQGQRPAVVPGPIKQTCADQIVERNRVEHVVDRGDRQPGLFSACRFQWLRPGVEHEV